MLSPGKVTCEGTFSMLTAFVFRPLKAPENSSSRTCSPAVWAATKRAGADADTAVGMERSFGKEVYQLSIGLLREGACAGFHQVGTQTSTDALS